MNNSTAGSVSIGRNKHGHIVLAFQGEDLTGEQEVQRIEAAKLPLDPAAKSCLLSQNDDGYDKNHRLIAGQRYQIALMSTSEIGHNDDRTYDALCNFGMETYGYKRPRAGCIVFVYRTTVLDRKLNEIGFHSIVAPHEPIKDYDGYSRLLRIEDDGFLGVVHPRRGLWPLDRAFAFEVPL